MNEHDEPSLEGMTVNERLVHVGLLDQWDAAVRRRDRNEMVALLEQVKVAKPHTTVDAVIANPLTYGF
jgi:hypothetical protein